MILRASGLRKRYGGGAGYDAVSQGDLTVKEGEFISIVGRSGSGKSTLLAMIGGLTKPSEGQVLLEGKDIWALSEKALADLRCRRMGFVFQFVCLLSSLRAVDNVALPALLGCSMAPEDAYERAQNLLARVGLEARMFAYPGEMSGGEQRRVVIARSLINRPRLLLADEPTGDLDEDTEYDIVALLEELRREAAFGMIVVTHNLDLAKRADRMFQMKQGVLRAADLPGVAIRPVPPRRFDVPRAEVLVNNTAPVDGARAIGNLGATLWAAAGRALILAGFAFALVLLGNYSLARYQRYQVALRRERLVALEELATSTLKSEIESVARLGDGHYEVTIYLENSGGDKPIYVMTSSVQGFIQVGSDWQEMPLTPVAEAVASVLKVTGKQLYRFVLDARVDRFTELLPHYMHVRLTNSMLISPESTPKDELFQRNDSYFIYLKPDNVDDATITKDVRFAGRPPLWIWMPPH